MTINTYTCVNVYVFNTYTYLTIYHLFFLANTALFKYKFVPCMLLCSLTLVYLAVPSF